MSDRSVASDHDNDEDAKLEDQRWQAFSEHVEDVVTAADDKDFTAAFNAMSQQAANLDIETFIDKVHLPDDAGEYAQVLAKLLSHIPDGYGRWISCDRGWYPLLAEFEQNLSALKKDYALYEIKQKYGELRINCSVRKEISPPDDFEPEYPHQGSELEKAQWSAEHKLWYQRVKEYLKTSEGRKIEKDDIALQNMADLLVKDIERKALNTCEVCSQQGQKTATKAASPWIAVLCERHMKEQGAILAEQWKGWWGKEEPFFVMRMRYSFIKRHEGEDSLVLSSDSSKRIAINAQYVSTTEEAIKIAAQSESYKNIWIGDDEVGKVYLLALAEHHTQHIKKSTEYVRVAKAAGELNPYAKAPPGFPSFYYLDDRLPETELGQSLSFLVRSAWLAKEYHREGPTESDDQWQLRTLGPVQDCSV
jgi:hypothetical protein